MIKLLEGEKIILQKRRHLFVLILELLPIFLAALAPLAVLASAEIIPVLRVVVFEYLVFVLFASSAWWLLLWMAAFVFWTNYYLDVLVVTNRRVIDIEQLGLFARDMAELQMARIQDVKTEVIGIIPSLLDMGDLHIQTAGTARELVVRHISNPHEIRNIIAKIHDETVSGRIP